MNTNNTNKIIGPYIVDLCQRLGKGAYGEVYLGKHKDTQKLVAIKMMPSQKDGQSRETFKKEVAIMQQLNHPNLVKFLAHFETVNNLYVMMEYCDGGTLSDYIQKQCKQAGLKYLAESEARIILKQIISGYKEMYDKNIVHRDLKPANILIHRGVVKITDFGFGKILHNYESDILKTFAGSPLYMSPQILYNNKKYTTKTDIWSLGIIFFEILFGSPPWNVQTMEQLMACVKKKNLVFPKYPMVSQEMKDIIQKMIEFEEKDRMGWEELFKLQQFFDQKNVDFIQQSIIKIKNEPDLFKKNILKKNLVMNNFVQNAEQVQLQLKEIQKLDKEILKQYDETSNASTSIPSSNVGRLKIFEERKPSVSPTRITLSPNKTISQFSEVDEDKYENLLNKNVIYEIADWVKHKRNKAFVLNYLTQQMFELLSEEKLFSDKDMYNVVCLVISKYQLLILYRTLTRLKKKCLDSTTKRFTEDQWKIFCKSQSDYQNAFKMIGNEYTVMKSFVHELIFVAKQSINNLNIPQFQDGLKVCNLSYQTKQEFDSIFYQIISFYFSLTKQTLKLENLTIEQLQFIYNLKNCMNVHKIFKFKKIDFFKYNDDLKNFTKDQLIAKILE